MRSIKNQSTYKSIMASVETFKSAVLRIRDILRGPGVGITGMESMRHICLYLLSRYMTRNRVGPLGIPGMFAWENILKAARIEEGGLQKALDIFWNPEDCLIDHFDRLFGTDRFSFDVKHLHKHKEILEILDGVDMNRIDCHMDILGWVYEQHLKTGSSSASRDLGQFFTDRFICDYMTKICNPGFKTDGVPESVCDPTMGTGGFLTSYIKYYKRNHPDVDWSVQQHQIHGCDTDGRVAGVARMNLFMELNGERATNLLTHDSLYGDLSLTGFDIILANMPFGVRGIKHAECCDRVKDLRIRGTKSEPLFLQLMTVSLNPGGRCAVVVPDGVLCNVSNLHTNTRKHLIDNYELKRVIKMKGKFFMNTSIEPSILYFENNGSPTLEIEFWEVTREEDGTLDEKMVLSIPREKLDDGYSLDLRRYQEDVREIYNPNDYTIVKISDVMGVVSGKTNKKRSGENPIPYYDSNGAVGYVSEALYDGEYTITARKLSIGSVHFIDGPFWPSDNTINFTSKDKNVMTNKYFYYWLLLNNKVLKRLSSGIKPGIRKSDVVNIAISVPPLEIQEEIVATLDRIYTPGTTELADTLKMTERAMDLILSSPDGVTLEPIVEAQRLISKSKQMVSDVKAQMVAIVKASTMSSLDPTTHKVSDVAIKNPENLKKSDKRININYIDLGSVSLGNVKKVKVIPFTEKPSRAQRKVKNGDIIWGSVRPLSRSYAYLTDIPDGTICSTGFVVIRNISPDTIISKYLYYLLTTDDCVSYLSNRSTGSSYPAFKCEVIMNYKIRIPSIDVQKDTLNRLNALQSQLDTLEMLQKQSENNAKFILEAYLPSENV